MKTLTSLLTALVLMVGVAGAADLWDQSDFDATAPGFFNNVAGGPPFGMTVYTVSHITVPADEMWSIDTISTFYSALNPDWASSVAQGNVHLFTKTGPLPIDGTDDATASPLVTMSAVFDTDHIVVTATGLGLELYPGEYWIGITPHGSAGIWGAEVHLSSMTLYGDASASYDPFAFPGPAAWYNFNPGVDASILIQGNLTVANEEMAWGDMKSLYR